MRKKKVDKKGERWTDEEKEYLEKTWGNVSLLTMKKHLKREIGSIKNVAWSMGLGAFCYAGDYMLLTELFEGLGYTPQGRILQRSEKIGMPIKYIKSEKQVYRKISLKDFWKWSEANKDKLSFAKFEPGALGEEPKWVQAKRKEDIRNHKRTTWTTEKDNLLYSMYISGRYNYEELAKELGITKSAVRNRIYILNKNKRKKISKKV